MKTAKLLLLVSCLLTTIAGSFASKAKSLHTFYRMDANLQCTIPTLMLATTWPVGEPIATPLIATVPTIFCSPITIYVDN